MTRRVFVDVVDNSKLHPYRQLDPNKKIEVYRYAIMLRRNGLGYKRIKRFIEKDFNVRIGLTTLRNWFSKRVTPMGLGHLIMEVINSPTNNELMGRGYGELNADERLKLRNEALKLYAKGYGPYKVRRILELKYGIDIPKGAITGWIYRNSLPQGRKKTILTDYSNLTIPAAISISDGALCRGKRKKLTVQTKDSELVKAFINSLEKLTDRLGYTIGYDSKKGVFYKTIYRGDLINFLSNEANVIMLLQSNPKEFIRLYFDCEGCPCGTIKMNRKSRKVEFEAMILTTNTNIRILDAIREELEKIGISSTIKIQTKRGRKSTIRGKEVTTKKDCYALVICRKESIIKFHEEIGFLSQRKQEKLKDIVDILKNFKTKESRAIEWIRLYNHQRRGKETWIKRRRPLKFEEALKTLKQLYPNYTPSFSLPSILPTSPYSLSNS